jgi:DNA segregation ATPase FtsK/SpoIIIE, S-DNA-T family
MSLAKRIESVLGDLRTPARVVEEREAAQVVRYRLAPGNYPYASDSIHRLVKVSEITSRVSDLELHTNIAGLRFVQDGHLWLEVPKPRHDLVPYREFVGDAESADLPAIIGKTVDGERLVLDLADSRTPHILVAGATGSGKSVCINSMIAGIVDTGLGSLQLALADPKYVEFKRYAQLNCLVGPVASEPADISEMLAWLIEEMNLRYARGVGRVLNQFITLVIDEYADLVTRNRGVERKLIQLAQKGRAAGIHIILATQRPSVDIVTGAIKANFPVRIAFQVATGTDSRVILDEQGAEKLCGLGDGIIKYGARSIRFKGAYASDQELDAIVARNTADEPIAPPQSREKGSGVYTSIFTHPPALGKQRR